MKTLSIEQLVALHSLLIMETGGSEGLRDIGRLEAVVAAQTQSVFGKEIYPTIFEKGAALIRGVISDHPFVDGNKRTGMLAGLTFLEVNGQKFNTKKGEIEDFAVQVATKHLGIAEIAAWLETHSK